ncbi:hypothetical protein LSH36_1642g00011 [Paralvinella palmiformis]|uniref:Uncharacterized protein n=1 Tax=Paralvinella palmiformis TaxID=53620 RepID=A0AAD9IRP6_9ANNE|nr:hypothetical protein LSH36_1642g00011 [Paralvinella palmiformis]
MELQPTQATEPKDPTEQLKDLLEPKDQTTPEQWTTPAQLAVSQQPTASGTDKQQPNQLIQQIGVANQTQNVFITNQLQQDKQKELERLWSSGLCDCCSDLPTCCFGCFCIPCLLFKVADRLSESCFMIYRIDKLLALRTKLRVKFRIQV